MRFLKRRAKNSEVTSFNKKSQGRDFYFFAIYFFNGIISTAYMATVHSAVKQDAFLLSATAAPPQQVAPPSVCGTR